MPAGARASGTPGPPGIVRTARTVAGAVAIAVLPGTGASAALVSIATRASMAWVATVAGTTTAAVSSGICATAPAGIACGRRRAAGGNRIAASGTRTRGRAFAASARCFTAPAADVRHVFAIAAHRLAAPAADIGHVRAVLAHRFAALPRDLALRFVVHGREAAVRALLIGASLVAPVLCVVAVRHGSLLHEMTDSSPEIDSAVSPLPAASVARDGKLLAGSKDAHAGNLAGVSLLI